jgi:hypothetical protein
MIEMGYYYFGTTQVLIVITTLCNINGVVIMEGIYQAVLQVNSPRPKARQLMFKRLRFSNSGKGITLYIFDQQVNSL